MDRSLSAAVSRSADIFSEQIRRAPKPVVRPRPLASDQPLRRYEIACLDDRGIVTEFTRQARQHPVFESAFSALSHGAIVTTDRGVMTVEDVLPGDQLRTASGMYDTLLWRGSVTLTPGKSETGALTRITADAMGYNRPAPDLVLGPAARILHRAPGVRRLTGCDAAFIPASDFVDGNAVLELVPSAPVKVYQLGFAAQRSLSVNGIEIETLHPGTAFALGLRGEALSEYLSLFPHKSSLEDFGIMDHPRLRLADLELLD